MVLAKVDPRDIMWISIAAGVLLIAAAVALALAWKFRRKLREEPSAGPTEPTFSLQQVREMHEKGLLSDEEYNSLKNRALQQEGPG